MSHFMEQFPCMRTIHGKSPCCRGKVIRFGRGRKQCVICHKTWRPRPKKRGRKELRVSIELIKRYVQHLSFHGDHNRLRRRILKSRDRYLASVCWEFPKGDEPLILILDGMWLSLAGKKHILYLALLRPVSSDKAIVLRPRVCEGNENAEGWLDMIDTIPREVRERIEALVCDGHRAFASVSMVYDWKVQRCHFHLFASIRNYVRTGRLGRRRLLGERILILLRTAISTRNERVLHGIMTELFALEQTVSSVRLRYNLRGFFRNFDEYRTYLSSPELFLPTTSNCAESLGQHIRDFLYRARGFRTRESFTRWVEVVCHMKGTITCNGKDQPN